MPRFCSLELCLQSSFRACDMVKILVDGSLQTLFRLKIQRSASCWPLKASSSLSSACSLPRFRRDLRIGRFWKGFPKLKPPSTRDFLSFVVKHHQTISGAESTELSLSKLSDFADVSAAMWENPSPVVTLPVQQYRTVQNSTCLQVLKQSNQNYPANLIP